MNLLPWFVEPVFWAPGISVQEKHDCRVVQARQGRKPEQEDLQTKT